MAKKKSGVSPTLTPKPQQTRRRKPQLNNRRKRRKRFDDAYIRKGRRGNPFWGTYGGGHGGGRPKGEPRPPKQKLTPEQRSEIMRRRWEKMTPEEREWQLRGLKGARGRHPENVGGGIDYIPVTEDEIEEEWDDLFEGADKLDNAWCIDKIKEISHLQGIAPNGDIVIWNTNQYYQEIQEMVAFCIDVLTDLNPYTSQMIRDFIQKLLDNFNFNYKEEEKADTRYVHAIRDAMSQIQAYISYITGTEIETEELPY